MEEITFSYYKNSYSGNSIPDETIFKKILYKSKLYLNNITFGRIKYDDDITKTALCAVCDVFYNQTEVPQLTSESMPDYSVVYKQDNKSIEQSLFETASLYLIGTGLLSRGVI